MAEVAKEYLIKIVADDSGVRTSKQTNSINPDAATIPTSRAGEKNNELIKDLIGAAALGKQVFNFATSNIGTFTGNSRLQEQINMGFKLAGHAAHIAISPITGIATLGLDFAQTAFMHNYNRNWENRDKDLKRAKLGMSAINKSR